MRNRVKSLKRVLAVQHQMVRLAEWRLETLKREESELKADAVRLHEFVSGGEPLSPLLSAAAFVRGKRLQSGIAKSELERNAQSAHSDTMRRREALAERLVSKAVAHAARELEGKTLQETIEAFAARDDASFP